MQFASVLALTLAAASGAAQADQTRTYIQYDANSDTFLEKKEFIDYSYNLVDYNHDGKVDGTEWTQYKTTFYQPLNVKMSISPDFTAYDMDHNGYIDSREYVNTYDSTLFQGWDKDGNGFIDGDEYDKVTVIYKDADTNKYYTW
jgi:hypothetical protein